MLNRIFVIIFLAIVLGGPFAAIIMITDGTKAFGNEMQQKKHVPVNRNRMWRRKHHCHDGRADIKGA
ncbi:hypothetical protein QW131_05710 [Roseibium salinum]|nr:hypothetical protein [Roseibium salinum]